MSGPEGSGDPGRHPLAARIVGVSISDSEDVARRGFLPMHVERAMAEIATQAAAAGARIGYGGDLRPNGFTLKLFRTVAELYGTSRIATEEPPFIHYLALPIWQTWQPAQLMEHVRRLSGTGEVVLVRPEGAALGVLLRQDGEAEPILEVVLRAPRMRVADEGALRLQTLLQAFARDVGLADLPDSGVLDSLAGLLPNGRLTGRDEAAVAEIFRSWQAGEAGQPADAFSAMRMFMAADEDARVILGGKTRDYAGHFPGIAEEALYSLAAGNPVIALTAFGGCAEDVATALLSAEAPARSDTGRGYPEIMCRLARGAPVFLEALKRVGLLDSYARISRLDSARPLLIGVRRLLENGRFAEAIRATADHFRSVLCAES